MDRGQRAKYNVHVGGTWAPLCQRRCASGVGVREGRAEAHTREWRDGGGSEGKVRGVGSAGTLGEMRASARHVGACPLLCLDVAPSSTLRHSRARASS